MRVMYANAVYRKGATSGRNVHVYQFIHNATMLGHEVWTWPPDEHPDAHRLPSSRLKQFAQLRRADVIYVRLEMSIPRLIRWAISLRHFLIGSVPIVWEFNTVPEFGQLLGRSEADIQRVIEEFKSYGCGCDLAICVSRALADYVRDKLCIKRVLIVPNGSDPALFRPDVPPVRRVQRKPDQLNVVWIGSCDLAWHNFALLYRAAQLLWKRRNGSRVAFHIIGRDLRLIRDMPPNINYYGPKDYEILPRWLSAMDVGLCLYHSGPADYGSPLKLFDYMASGLAVVGTFQPQLREIFEKLGQTDLLIPPNDAEALADVLLDLALNRKRICCQAYAGRQIVIDFYNWHRAVRDTFREIETIST